MAEFEGGEMSEEAGEAEMAGDAEAASNVLDDVSAEAEMGADASETAETSEKLNKLTENRLESVDTSNEKIATDIGLEGTVGDTLDDINDGKVTEDTTKLKSWWDKITEKIRNSGTTLEKYAEKYGNKIGALLVLGIILSSNMLPVKGASQCFQMPTCGNGGQVNTINCSKQYCNCAGISSCGYPACGQAATNCMYYYYQTMDAKTIIASIPYIAYTTYLAPQPPKSETFKKILILLGILIIGCAVIFMIYKLSNK
jgi:hypothetical protein